MQSSRWSPLQKWIMSIVGIVASSLITVLIFSQIKTLRENVRLEMRLERLESIPFPTTFPPYETRNDITIIKMQVSQIREQLEELQNEIAAHRHYTPSDPANLQRHDHQFP